MSDNQWTSSIESVKPDLIRFSWATFDVTTLLPADWDTQIIEVARSLRATKLIKPPHDTSREDTEIEALQILTVRGEKVWEELPWVIDLYRGTFHDLGEQYLQRRLTVAQDRRYAVVVNVQEPDGSRYECHVDTNPLEGLLYVTSHRAGAGGELVIANDVHARSIQDVDRDCSILYPQSGQLVFFDGRFHPHYVRPLLEGEIRVAVAMNYYHSDCPESTRPPDLNEYLYGDVPPR